MKKIFILINISILFTVSKWTAQGDFSNNYNLFPAIQNQILPYTNEKTNINIPTTIISTYLNNNFGSFWNVIVADPDQSDALGDSAVFGYAFKQHWFWKGSTKASPVVWIIWKDYNCVVVKHFDYGQSNVQNSFDGKMLSVAQVLQKASIRDQVLLKIPNPNIWDNLVRIYDQVNALFQGTYTIIGMQYQTNIYVKGSICTFGTSRKSPNYSSHRFTTNGKKYFVMILGMSNVYGGDTPKIKPTAPFIPSCLVPPNIANVPNCI